MVVMEQVAVLEAVLVWPTLDAQELYQWLLARLRRQHRQMLEGGGADPMLGLQHII